MFEIVYWHWLALGAMFAAVEILAPGVFFLWLGVAAIATGLLLLVVPAVPWPVQLLLFALLAIVAVYLGRRYFAGRVWPSDHPDLNRRGQEYVGQTFTTSEATTDGRGRLRVGDGWWRMASVDGDLPGGTQVRVVGLDGTTLRVQRID